MKTIIWLDLLLVFCSYLIASILFSDALSSVVNYSLYLFFIYGVSFYLFMRHKTPFIEELFNLLFSVLLGFSGVLILKLWMTFQMRLGTILFSQFVILIFLCALRVFYRFSYLIWNRRYLKDDSKRTLIIGAGSAGALIVRELKQNPTLNNRPIGFVDDDIKKQGKRILGLKVLGTTADLPAVVSAQTIEEIILAIPSATKGQIQTILKKCETISCKVMVFPPFYEVMGKTFDLSKLREVEIRDLLGREEMKTDLVAIRQKYEQEIILITGGGGSIGSELCRQLVDMHPQMILIFDIYENNAYDLEQEIKMRFEKEPHLYQPEILVRIGSVQDEGCLREIFETFHPSVVFHAAAHKHVPLMENSPKEAIKNNVFGTYQLAKWSDTYHVKQFVLISSDKAVNPTNIMGATKRLAELIIGAFNEVSETKFSVVRFGNVLGSSGSVIPLFKKQIAQGGPLTVTHEAVTRYFMTIQEAVSLVLQSGAFASGGEIFVLDMGEPVKILDLAKNLIRLSGFEPYKEIGIKITGLRPGEKLYEELLLAEEKLKTTKHKHIYVFEQVSIGMERIQSTIDELESMLITHNVNVKQLFRKYITTYQEVTE